MSLSHSWEGGPPPLWQLRIADCGLLITNHDVKRRLQFAIINPQSGIESGGRPPSPLLRQGHLNLIDQNSKPQTRNRLRSISRAA